MECAGSRLKTTAREFPKELQQKVLEPFFTTKTQGTGLGLSIVARRIAEAGGSWNCQPSREWPRHAVRCDCTQAKRGERAAVNAGACFESETQRRREGRPLESRAREGRSLYENNIDC